MGKISKGAPAKFTTHKGSWGDKYIIENNHASPKSYVTCADCKYYNDDKSCEKEPVYIPEVGYGNWKYCKSFLLSQSASNFYEKEQIVIRLRSEEYVEPELSKELLRQNEQDLQGIRTVQSIRTVQGMQTSQRTQIAKSITARTIQSTSETGKKIDDSIRMFPGNNHYYWAVPSDTIKLYKKYASGDQQEYIQCKSYIPKQMYECFKLYCIDRKTDRLDQCMRGFIKNLRISAPDTKDVMIFREAIICEVFKLLFMKPSYYNLSEGKFNRLFTDAFVELLKKKKMI